MHELVEHGVDVCQLRERDSLVLSHVVPVYRNNTSSQEGEMPPCISKDREDLVAAAGNRLIQVRSYGHRAVHTVPTLSSMVLAHYYLCFLRAPSCLATLRGCVARVCGETYMISPEVQQDLYGRVRYVLR